MELHDGFSFYLRVVHCLIIYTYLCYRICLNLNEVLTLYLLTRCGEILEVSGNGELNVLLT